MRNLSLILFLLSLYAFPCSGQADTLLPFLQKQVEKVHHQTSPQATESWPKADLQFALYDWYINIRFKHGIDTVLTQLQYAEQAMLAQHEMELAKLAWSLRFLHKVNHDIYPSTDSLYRTIETFRQDAQNKGWDTEMLETGFMNGYKRFELSDFGAGMELMLKHYDELEKINWPDPVIGMILHRNLGNSFYKFGDIENCIRYLRAGLRMPAPRSSPGFDYQTFNTIGLCFSKLTQYDSAMHYLTLSRTYAAMHRDSFWMCLMDGNMGEILFTRGQSAEAKPYLLRDYEGSIRAGFLGSAANAASLLASIELQEGHAQTATEYLKYSGVHRDTFDLESGINYYTNVFKYYKLKKEYNQAVLYADSLQALKKRKDLVMDKKVLDQAEIKVQMAKYDADVKLLTAARDRQVVMRNGLIIILILCAGIAILFITRIMLKRRTALDNLARAQEELSRYTSSLLEKNNMIQAFQAEMERMKESGFVSSDERSVSISSLMHTPILTEEHWRHFRQLFDTVYPGFLVRLREKFGDLTPAEMRLLALTKLQLPVNDMAQVLGISPDSIRKSRYRLRKKINLPEEGSLDELISLI